MVSHAYSPAGENKVDRMMTIVPTECIADSQNMNNRHDCNYAKYLPFKYKKGGNYTFCPTNKGSDALTNKPKSTTAMSVSLFRYHNRGIELEGECGCECAS